MTDRTPKMLVWTFLAQRFTHVRINWHLLATYTAHENYQMAFTLKGYIDTCWLGVRLISHDYLQLHVDKIMAKYRDFFVNRKPKKCVLKNTNVCVDKARVVLERSVVSSVILCCETVLCFGWPAPAPVMSINVPSSCSHLIFSTTFIHLL